MNFHEQIVAWQIWSQVFCPRHTATYRPYNEGTPPRLHRRKGTGVNRWRLRRRKRLVVGQGPDHIPGIRAKRRREARHFWGAFVRGEVA